MRAVACCTWPQSPQPITKESFVNVLSASGSVVAAT